MNQPTLIGTIWLVLLNGFNIASEGEPWQGSKRYVAEMFDLPSCIHVATRLNQGLVKEERLYDVWVCEPKEQ